MKSLMRRILSAFLCLVIAVSASLLPAAAEETINEEDAPVVKNTVSLNCYAAILLNMDTMETLFEYDADEQNYPASTTKIMTAYLCCKYGNPDDKITVSEDAFSDISDRASTGGLEVGETMTVHRALQALLVVSASEAANVIGEYISGSHEEFVDLMNEEAAALGCTGTHFANCHGLPNRNHYTTAHDLARIAAAAMQYEEFRNIVGSAVTTMEATNMHSETSITSTNGILPGSSYPQYNYPYAIGIKTGHTSVAGYCLVSAADKDGVRLLCVIMGCTTREASFSQTLSLYDWGYENYDALAYNGVVTAADDIQVSGEGYNASEDSSIEDTDNQYEGIIEDAEASAVEVTPSPTVVPVAETAVSEAPAPSAVSEAESGSDYVPFFGSRTLLFVLLGGVIVLIALFVVIGVVTRRRDDDE